PEPPYPGTFAGTSSHAHAYREPTAFAGRRVLVVGTGNSAMDIATELAGHAGEVLLSARRGVWVLPKRLLGRPTDQWNGALAAVLPWRLRQQVSQAIRRLAARGQDGPALPPSPEGVLQDPPTLSDTVPAPVALRRVRRRRGALRRRARGRAAPRPVVHRGPGGRPLPRPGAGAGSGAAAPVPARVPARRARAVLRRPHAVHGIGPAGRRGAGQTARRPPVRTAAPAAPGPDAGRGRLGTPGGAGTVGCEAPAHAHRRGPLPPPGEPGPDGRPAHGTPDGRAQGAGDGRVGNLRPGARRAVHRTRRTGR